MTLSTAAHSIEVRSLSKRFGSFTAVDGVSFAVERGEIFGYLGANGAGKSTTIRMLCGLLPPSSGQASVGGFDIGRQALQVKRSIGYMSQKFSLYLDLTVLHNLEFFGGAYGLSGKLLRTRIDEALAQADLATRRNELAGSLPGGLRQRLALASAMLHRPAILFLDEPTAGVSPDARRDFWRTIRQLARGGTTLFVTTHHLDEAEYCARVGLMVDGRLVALGTPPALKRTHVPGALFSVATGALHAPFAAALRARPEVVEVQPFGLRAHVRLRAVEASDADFTALLAAVGHPLPFERAEATLEDVFLQLVSRTAE